MKVVGYILLACLAIAVIQYAIILAFAVALLWALLNAPKETIALIAFAALLNGIAVHPVPILAGLLGLLVVGFALRFRW
jgi:hypothetical protein